MSMEPGTTGPPELSSGPRTEPNWEQAPESGRRETLLRALRRLSEVRAGPVCIVETGTLRNETPTGCAGDGWSTITWSWYVSQVGGLVFTVDINAEALAVCRRLTAPYADRVRYIQS